MAEPWEGRAVHPEEPEEKPDIRELGVTGTTVYGSFVMDEYNPDLSGARGIRTYDKMRRQDAQVRGTLRLVKTPITAAEWFVEPASNDQVDLDAADFVDWNFFSGLHHPWGRFLWEALSMLDFGYYIFEKVYEWGQWTPRRDGARTKPVVYIKKLGPRHPISIYQVLYDSVGDPVAFEQEAMTDDGLHRVTIPFEKCLVFTLDEEASDPTGMSILRSAYKHWYYKDNLYKVDAIQKERHGIGIPDIALPMGFSPADRALAEQIGSNLRTNEKSYIVRPPGWEVGFVELKGNPVDALKSAEHHDMMIARNVLAQFMNLGSTTSGSRALGGSQMEIFVKALRYVSGIVADQFNTYIVPQLVDYNFNVKRYPKLRVRRIGENADWRSLSVAIRNMIESQIITATPELEEWMAKQMDLPHPAQEALERPMEDRVKVKPSAERGAENLPGQEDTTPPKKGGQPAPPKPTE